MEMASTDIKLDPTGFDISISTILTKVGAEQYVNIFRKHNIGQCTLTELSDEDLAKLGVDDADIRKKLLNGVKNLPIFNEAITNSVEETNFLSPAELADILEESSQHLNRIYVSLVTNTTALKRTSKLVDSVLYQDKYASDVAICTLSEITNILNSMEIALHTKLKVLTQDLDNRKNKKLIVGAVGSAVVAVLTVFFVKSLKQLN